MQYDEDDLVPFEEQKQMLLNDDKFAEMDKVVGVFDRLTDFLKVELSHIIKTEDTADFSLYIYVNQALKDMDYLNKSGLPYGDKFERELDALKNKVDLVSSLSLDSVKILLPKSFQEIKENFYRTCIANKMPDALIAELFRKVIGNKKLTGRFANTDENPINPLDSIKERAYISTIKELKDAFFNTDEIDKEMLLQQRKDAYKNYMESDYFKTKYYIGNPN